MMEPIGPYMTDAHRRAKNIIARAARDRKRLVLPHLKGDFISRVRDPKVEWGIADTPFVIDVGVWVDIVRKTDRPMGIEGEEQITSIALAIEIMQTAPSSEAKVQHCREAGIPLIEFSIADCGSIEDLQHGVLSRAAKKRWLSVGAFEPYLHGWSQPMLIPVPR